MERHRITVIPAVPPDRLHIRVDGYRVGDGSVQLKAVVYKIRRVMEHAVYPVSISGGQPVQEEGRGEHKPGRHYQDQDAGICCKDAQDVFVGKFFYDSHFFIPHFTDAVFIRTAFRFRLACYSFAIIIP